MTTSKPRLLCIVGPTCSGKTAAAVEEARACRGEIISADSRQIFRGMDIGTAKPSTEILAEIPHHFIDIINPDETYSAGRFAHEATRCVAEILARGNTPIVAGGSGLYIRALIDGIHSAPGHDQQRRELLEARLHREGVDSLLAELERVDPATAAGIHMKHERRIIRALEVFEATGIPLSEWRRTASPPPFTPEMIAFTWDRKELYSRIDARVDAMMTAGLLDEVRTLQSRGYTDALQSLNTPGYKELFALLRSEITLDRAVELIKQHSRNYAKRQVTWFTRDPRVKWEEFPVTFRNR